MFYNLKKKCLFPNVLLVSVLSASLVSACASEVEEGSTRDVSSSSSDTLFSEVFNVIPFEDLNRRKFDAPVIADLDQDGASDLIVNEHGQGMKVFWNDGETFSKGPIIKTGDVHGVTISDLDGNGLLDIIITQGGGNGGNPRRPVLIEVNKDREFTNPIPFSYFEPGRGRAVKLIPNTTTKKLDLLVTGFPMPSQKKDGANHIYTNVGDSKFEFAGNLPQAKWLGYRPHLTDFNNDGVKDVIFHGGQDMVAVERYSDGSFLEKSTDVLGDLRDTSDVSTITEIDFDNDGDKDIFITRADRQFSNESFYNEAERRFAFITFLRDYLFDDILVDGDLIIENLQRMYPHRNVYLGASKTPYEFTGDPHGHQDIKIKVEDALGWPEGETKGGMYVGYIGDGYWRIAGQSRSRTAATIKNVDQVPSVTPQIELPAKLYENRNGTFVDVTEAAGLKILGKTTGATTADFNNDGFLDLAVLKYGSMASKNEHILLLNTGRGGFEAVANHGLKATEVGSTGGFAQAFDYDEDGAMDIIYSNERGKWHLMKNMLPATKTNNHLMVDVSKFSAGRPELGAIVKVESCGVEQSREVGSTSAAYSQNYDLKLHFGLGECSKLDVVTISWFDGTHDTVTDAVEIK